MSKKLEWYVYRRNINADKIEKFNVFDHSGFRKDVEAIMTGHPVWTYGDSSLSEQLRHTAMYYFWSKCEHEVVITSWPPYVEKTEVDRLNNEFAKYEELWGRSCARDNVRLTVAEKIDIYDQLMLNWDAFVKYMTENYQEEVKQ